MKDLKPKEIVTELDKYIIGQKDAKKSVAIALRNRWRRNLFLHQFLFNFYLFTRLFISGL